MTPYFVKAPGEYAQWIDLDHVLAISDFQAKVGDPNGASPRASFSITFAFRTEPMIFYVHDQCFFRGINEGSYVATYDYLPASQQDVDMLREAYDHLLRKWKQR